jgi:hypothetical protein
MVPRLAPGLAIVGVVLLGKPGASQEAPFFKTLEDATSFTETYYQNPRPELIADLIGALHSSGVTERPNGVPPFIGFFSEVFGAHPAHLAEWRALVAKQEASTRRLLYRALSISKAGGVLTLDGHSAALNDMYWGAFFASGRTAFLQKLVDQLRYSDERDDEALFFAGATAKWSLANNAQSHPLVRSTLEGHALTADPRTRALISELLAQGPARVKQDIADVVRHQREIGKWAAQQIANPSVIWKRRLEVDTLQRLSIERAERQAATIPDPRGIAARCAAQLEQARTYGSLSRILDRSVPELAARGYVRITWIVDHVEPDRTHVLQVAWDGQAEVSDEWITITDREFALLATWMELPRPARNELGKKLSVRKYVPVLRDEQPLSAVTYSYAGKRYALLTYRHPIEGDFVGLFPGSGGSVRLELWIDSASGLLAKARGVPTGAPTGAVPPELEEVFVGYSDDIRIEAPPAAPKTKDSSDTSRGG